jgi:ketosteroid isomerase-like protein
MTTMGAAEDVAVVRRGYEAFNTVGSLAGDHEGRDATFAYFGQLAGQTGGTFRAELRYVAGDGEGHVIALHRNSGDRDGKHLDLDRCLVLELKDGQVTDGREHFGDLYAWDDFWS